MNNIEKYIENLAIAIDEFFNAAALLGDPHETISSHVGKLAAQGVPGADKAQQAINFLMLNNPTHCQDAAQHEAAVGKDGVIPD